MVADYNLETEYLIVKDIGDQHIKTLFFDANDYDSMIKLYPGYDVVVNGLPWKYDVPVTKACVEVGLYVLEVSTNG